MTGANQFCTYFDSKYILKGLTLLHSLEKHGSDFTLWVLCLDNATFDLLAAMENPRLRTIRLAELELWEPRLLTAKANRSSVEYYWTCTPTWVAYVLAQQPPGSWVSYMDADLFFYDQVAEVFDEAGTASVIIHEHRFAPKYAYMAATSGIYNVGLTGFHSDPDGWNALRWWQAACLEACSLSPERGLCGDQKYLDDWPRRFPAIHVLLNPGAGLAPWNITNYKYRFCNGALNVDSHPLIFYHFHAFQLVSRHLMGQHGYDIPDMVRKYVYGPYIRALQDTLARIFNVEPHFQAGFQWPPLRQLFSDLRYGRYFWE